MHGFTIMMSSRPARAKLVRLETQGRERAAWKWFPVKKTNNWSRCVRESDARAPRRPGEEQTVHVLSTILTRQEEGGVRQPGARASNFATLQRTSRKHLFSARKSRSARAWLQLRVTQLPAAAPGVERGHARGEETRSKTHANTHMVNEKSPLDKQRERRAHLSPGSCSWYSPELQVRLPCSGRGSGLQHSRGSSQCPRSLSTRTDSFLLLSPEQINTELTSQRSQSARRAADRQQAASKH